MRVTFESLSRGVVVGRVILGAHNLIFTGLAFGLVVELFGPLVGISPVGMVLAGGWREVLGRFW